MNKLEPGYFWKNFVANLVSCAIIVVVVFVLVCALEAVWDYLMATWRPL